MSDPRDAIEPHDADTAQAQLDWVLAHCSDKRVLDAGCGHGRIAIPLAEAGAQVVAVDTDAASLDVITRAAPDVTVMLADMTSCAVEPASIDVVLCLGNTFALVHDVDKAVATMQHWATCLRPGGTIVLDDLAGDLWPELTGGNWCAGVDEDGRQLVWADDDSVFALRDAIGVPSLVDSDTAMRLWTAGALRLLARASGLSGPIVDRAGAVRIFSDPKNTGE